MSRRLLNLVHGASLLLCLTVGALWLRSELRYPEALEWRFNDPHDRESRQVMVVSGGGAVALASSYRSYRSWDENLWAWFSTHDREWLGDRLRYNDQLGFAPNIKWTYTNYPEWKYFAGFAWARRQEYRRRVVNRAYNTVTRPVTSSLWVVAVPYWSLVLAAAALPAGRMLRTRRRLRAARRGHCPRCGYDVSATPQRCPECGDDPRAAQAPLAAAARRHMIVFKLACLLALMGFTTWATVKLHARLGEQKERRQLGKEALRPVTPAAGPGASNAAHAAASASIGRTAEPCRRVVRTPASASAAVPNTCGGRRARVDWTALVARRPPNGGLSCRGRCSASSPSWRRPGSSAVVPASARMRRARR